MLLLLTLPGILSQLKINSSKEFQILFAPRNDTTISLRILARATIARVVCFSLISTDSLFHIL